ncbi:hypothetical protein C1H76_4097 [Elsinoe australis]|uniref:Uncharacterized protein n=1 Tax=Elsinoe australis TaxID=40998 RepID=A0A4U7B1R3_9PEZI|nr:hypothetical protein C1H76_4097 [Elsinoe australis]
MPSIFSRRRGSTGQMHHNAPVSSAAAVAANSAFLKNSPSAASLSNAAAAAALRSHTTTPEPIAHLQTKRMVRRGSQSSNGSGVIMGGPGQGQRPVVRRSSQGSMTERSFRSPSPGRTSPHGARPAAEDAPPVPAVPASRPVSRASQTPTTAKSTTPAPVKVYQPTGLPKVQELQREGSQNSINFSRPNYSPPVSPTRPKTAGSWFGAPTETNVAPRQSVHDRPKSALSMSSGTKSGIEAGLQSVGRSPSKKKQKPATANQGARLAAGSLSPGPQGTAVPSSGQETKVTTSQPEQSAQIFKQQPKKKQAAKSPAKSAPAPAEPAGSDADVSDIDRRMKSPSPSGERRPTHTLNKQPSVVMEEPESEQDAIARKRRSQDGPYPKMAFAKRSPVLEQQLGPRSREPSLTPSMSSAGSPQQRSRFSLEVPEPHRSAHFSNNVVDTPSGIRHNPPPRSVSPAKSALKHSPSSSIRTSSPVISNSPPNRPPGSDTSDTMSMTSQDGIRAGKRKKSVRVSFDESAIEKVPEQQEKPHVNGIKTARRSLSPAMSDEDLDDETMKPRPALPSFGSVRNSASRKDQPDTVEKVTETLPDKRTKQHDVSQGVSSDHAIASILVSDREHKASRNENEPLPPEVTSVEGSGHFTDSAESSDEEELVKVAVPPQQEPARQHTEPINAVEKGSVPNAAGEPSQSIDVPDIQVLPATPGIEEPSKPIEVQEPRSARISVPGGWDDAEEDMIEEENAQVAGSTSAQAVSVPASQPQPQLQPVEVPSEPAEESDSDDSAAFSDAAEDASEMEAFGYASLDAIVESPVPPRAHKTEEPTSPTMSTPLMDSTPEISTPTTDGKDWSRASAYWSNQKQQLQRRESDQPSADEAAPAPVSTKTKTKSTKPKSKPVVEVAQSAAQPKSRASGAKQPAQQMRSSMRTSMREAPPQVTDERPTAFRKTMRGPPPEAARSAQQTRTQQAPKSAMQQKTMRPASAGGPPRQAAAPVQKPRAAPVAPKDDSDSESSFRRKPRRGSASETGGYTMKRSMRSGSVDMARERRPSSSQSAAGAGRWSLRSLSPVGDTPQSAKSNFRTSLRGTSIPEAPTLRGNSSIAKERAPKTSSKFSMSGFSRAKSPPPTAAPASKKAFKSRFADSDSEGEAPAARPARAAKGGFKSRFVDSDDEDTQPRHMPADLTPVRGIPRPKNDTGNDSTDLDDSSDDEFSRRRRAKRDSARTVAKPIVPSQADVERAMAAARQNVASMTGNQSLLEPEQTPTKGKVQKRVTLQTEARPQSPPASPSKADGAPVRRKGLLGSIFGRRNSSSSVTSPVAKQPMAAAPGTEMSPPASPSSPRGKLQRRQAPKLQRSSSAQSNMSVTSTTTANAPNTPAMPALEEGKEEDEEDVANWPLAPLAPPPKMPAAIAEGSRPASSDGVTESGRSKMAEGRPALGTRSRSGNELGKKEGPGEGPGVYSDKTGKKKRFGRLRKAFGLND